MMDDTTCNCQWCMLFGKKEEALPSCDTTFLVPISYMDDDALNKLVDWETAENLPQSLAEQFPSNLIPLRTTGDGNCLLHAISRALFGVEVFNELLRKRMHEELRANAEWYCKVAPQFGEEDWKRILDNAGKSGSYLEFMHIFALSNVIARPIVIYANDGDMDKFGQGESGVAATFVPSRVGRARCRHRPLILAWQSRAKNHYVPLVQIADRDAVQWPALAPAFPNSLAAGETYADYLHFDAPVIDPPLLKKLEEQRIERQKKEELIQLMSRAFTGQAAKSPRGKGKEKKLDDEDEMDEEEEGEYGEDSTRDQREALTQLKKYIEYACLPHLK
ncbi:OTUlike cysteine protease protein [Acanthamoeba castellanii str. Neff]|uniref:OTUlike cysteine protease protein n=1 Tax=Acanthamoeba castellanii (strain ATCC 30010 / Neff) TaxID=1257118 RepID=L8H1F7_ACACF|nr:OTUlike cysteine protease protein [Acanthamoeba castellanii str. Neff]ELR19052.1 OTUlike cysteine protease protein [Acanthamoeba castellanii str. Neff]